MRSFINNLLFVLLMIGFCLSALAQGFNQKIHDTITKYGAVGLSTVVVKNNAVIYKESFGYQDLEKKIPLKPNHLFRIASISKSFTATAVLQLVENGKLALDDDISDLIGFKVRNPKFPGAPITLKMILSHTSSLNDHRGYFTLDSINPTKTKNWGKSYNNYEPGKGYDYGNINFNLAGAILEKYSNTRFDQSIFENVLQPLGLRAGYDVDALPKEKFAKLYYYDPKTDEMVESPDAYRSLKGRLTPYKIGYDAPLFSPTGGLKIAAEDLAKYMRMHLNYGTLNGQQLIRSEHAKLMQSRITKTADKSWYGLGLFNVENLIKNRTLIGHTGDAYGLYSALFFDPEEKFGFVVITNGSKITENGAYNSLLKPVINLLYEEFIKD